ncbi:MAG TPA: Hsp33 family molecular chaperone HslO [Syntrophales bacterium]|nr:Hsp33 family molecular chaperone HslO [Syntrophales bacterium]
MNNYLIRVIGERASVIGLACVTTGLVNRACRIHGTSPAASAALGRALTGAALMGNLMKAGQRIGLKFEGNGPLGKILAEAEYTGAVRGFVGNPGAEAPLREGKLNVSGVLGKEGFLTVFKDTGADEPYQGIVKLRTGEIAEDLAYYFAESEQVPSALGLGVYVEPGGEITASGGFLVQTLPPQDEEIVDLLIERIGRLPPVTEFLRDGGRPEGLLESIFRGIPTRLLEKKSLFWRCACSRERIERVLLSLGKEELTRLLEEEEQTVVTCEFCGTSYSFPRDEMAGLLRQLEVLPC